MLLQEASDIEGFLNSLKDELKVQITSNINFIIIKYLSQQKNLDPYSFTDKFSSILSEESQTKLLDEIRDVLGRLSTKEVVKIDDKFKDDIAKAIKNNVKKDSEHSISANISEEMKVKANNIINKLPESEIPKTESEKTINKKTKLEEYEALQFDFPSVIDGLKYIKPELTEKTRDELLKFGFEPKIYSALRTLYHAESLYDLYKKHFANISIIDFVRSRILNLEKNQYLTFIKRPDMPENKVFRLKMGEFLLSMNKISKENLDIAVELQMKGAEEQENKTRRLLGDIIVEHGHITKDDLEATIEIQKWYNNLFS